MTFRDAYRLELIPRMVFFSSLRASASTSRFHRSDFHSGPPRLVIDSDRAFRRIVSEVSDEPGRRLILTPGLALTSLTSLLSAVERSIATEDVRSDRTRHLSRKWHMKHALHRPANVWGLPPILNVAPLGRNGAARGPTGVPGTSRGPRALRARECANSGYLHQPLLCINVLRPCLLYPGRDSAKTGFSRGAHVWLLWRRMRHRQPVPSLRDLCGHYLGYVTSSRAPMGVTAHLWYCFA